MHAIKSLKGPGVDTVALTTKIFMHWIVFSNKRSVCEASLDYYE